MVEFLARKIRPADDNQDDVTGVRIGRIAAIREDGLPTVDFRGNPLGPLPARSIVRIERGHSGAQVLLAFDSNDLQCPIIVGLLQQQGKSVDQTVAAALNRELVTEVVFDGERLVLDAKREVEIRCGKSALIMNADGKVIIKGEQIISRARRVNKIKGAAVKIN